MSGVGLSVRARRARLWADVPRSIQFNVVSKGLGSERMAFFLDEAAGDVRDLLLPTLEPARAKL